MSEKVLVAYATRMGATATIAAAIGAELRRAGHEVEVHEVTDVKAVSEYGAVVVGSAIYFGRWRPEAVRFLRDHARELRSRPVWLFHSGPIGPGRDVPQTVPSDVDRLAAKIGARPVRTFSGNLQPDTAAGGRARRARVDTMVGDARDWPQIRTWADEIAAALS
ncbi:flavodoxin domain-containing protein [Kribbella sp. NPDC050124]|uniref:flavodoxin domain-containing protein n=1 Tax=Kribbella sp. NPDC050124 TaxID=3364114 RepID=UPI003795AD0A